MHVAWARMWQHGWVTFELGPGAQIPEIGEDELVAAQARVRALIVSRLEALYAPVERRLEDDHDHSRPIDPRMLEIGRAILKDLAGHYRLARPPAAVDDDDDGLGLTGVDRAAAIEEKLVALESRLRETVPRTGNHRTGD